MASIANYDTVINARCAGLYQDFIWYNWSRVEVASQPKNKSSWAMGCEAPYGDGTAIGVANLATLTANGTLFSANSAAGAMRPALLPPSGGRQKWLTMAGYFTTVEVQQSASSSAVMFGAMAVDILWACYQAAATTSATAAAFPTLRRYASGAGVKIAAWVAGAALGYGSIATITVTYTNQDGVSGRTTTGKLPASATQGVMATTKFSGSHAAYVDIPNSPFLELQAGDTGVRSIQNISFNASLVSGNIIVALVKPLVTFPPSPMTNGLVTEDLLATPEGPVELVVGSDGQPGCITMITSCIETAEVGVGELCAHFNTVEV